MQDVKTCQACKQDKETSLFGRDKARKDGLNYVCKSCVIERSKMYREKNPEKRKETCKNYREKNPAACKESYLKWQAREQSNGWAVKKAYDKANPDQKKLRSKKWVQNNPDYMKMQKHRRRGAGGSFSKKDIDFLMKSQNQKCVVCLTSIVETRHIDHILPIALGGTNHPSNLQILCPKCNRQKSAKHPIDFMQEKGFLL